jgi:hypothetical protein
MVTGGHVRKIMSKARCDVFRWAVDKWFQVIAQQICVNRVVDFDWRAVRQDFLICKHSHRTDSHVRRWDRGQRESGVALRLELKRAGA